MSEGSLIMGTGRGKLGNMVLYRAGGQERQRAYISRIANPQSTGQIINRSRFRISGVSYKSLAAASERISLASRATTAYNAFISRNVSQAPYHYKNFVEFCAQNGFALPAPWKVANGSLVTPTFLQGGVAWSGNSDAGNTGTLVVTTTMAFMKSLGFSTLSLDSQQALTAIWAALGISSDIHLCSCVGTGVTISNSQFSSYANKVAMVSNIHALCEIWPDCPDLLTTSFNYTPDTGEVNMGPGAVSVTTGVPLFGTVVTIASDVHAAVSIKVATDTSSEVVTWTLYFHDIPTPSAQGTQLGNFGAVWIANGSTDATSTASLTLSSGLTTAYNTLLGESWRDEVLPSWRTSGSSTNEGVYNG